MLQKPPAPLTRRQPAPAPPQPPDDRAAEIAATLKRLYRGVSGYEQASIGPDGKPLREATARIYGELTARGGRQLLAAIPFSPRDRFVDLGSGLGKLVLQIAMSVEKIHCTGLEINGTRHARACQVLQQAELAGALQPRRARFLHQDILTADLSRATILFANSVCFPDRLMSDLTRKIAAIPHPVWFATSRPLHGRAAAHFDLVSTIPCQATWSRHATVNLYRTADRRGAE